MFKRRNVQGLLHEYPVRVAGILYLENRRDGGFVIRNFVTIIFVLCNITQDNPLKVVFMQLGYGILSFQISDYPFYRFVVWFQPGPVRRIRHFPGSDHFRGWFLHVHVNTKI